MKNYDYKNNFNKWKEKEHRKEQNAQGFRCSHCRQFVFINEFMGTMHRNHCNYCLWSKHVDLNKPGDRLETCRAGMKPIGLIFKNLKKDKYGNFRKGEIKIVNRCVMDGKFSSNRIAADDDSNKLFEVFANSKSLNDQIKRQLFYSGIELLDDCDLEELNKQLSGK